MHRFQILTAAFVAIIVSPAFAEPAKEKPKEPDWKSLFDGKELGKWKSTDFGGQGEVKVEKGELILETGEPLTGVTWQKKEELPTDNFEITLEAMKLKGDDFFCGLTFPVRKSYCSLICGGWGGGVVGISSINNFDASENETTKYQEFKKNKWYKIRVRVADDKIQAWIDDDQLVDVELKDKKISTRFEVDVSQPLGISAYRTKAALRNIKIRKVEPGEKEEKKEEKNEEKK
jgi:3-keto-disaccharide hydrolase